MNYAEALEHKASMRRGKETAAKSKLQQMTIKPAENGGHIVEHHFANSEGGYHEPETHVFAKGEGAKMLAHVKDHLGLKEESGHPGQSEDPAEEPEED